MSSKAESEIKERVVHVNSIPSVEPIRLEVTEFIKDIREITENPSPLIYVTNEGLSSNGDLNVNVIPQKLIYQSPIRSVIAVYRTFKGFYEFHLGRDAVLLATMPNCENCHILERELAEFVNSKKPPYEIGVIHMEVPYISEWLKENILRRNTMALCCIIPQRHAL